MNRLGTKELYLHLTETIPTFNVNTQYSSLVRSKKLLEEWLHEQFGGQGAKALLQHWLDIADRNRKATRKHCIYICGPPNGGKSNFLQCVADAFVNTAYVDNKWQSSFSFSNLLNCRLALWDEPKLPTGGKYPVPNGTWLLHGTQNQMTPGDSLLITFPAGLENLKNLFSGKRFATDVKGSSFENVENIGILMSSNSVIFPRDKMWDSRIEYYKMQGLSEGMYIEILNNELMHNVINISNLL